MNFGRYSFPTWTIFSQSTSEKTAYAKTAIPVGTTVYLSVGISEIALRA